MDFTGAWFFDKKTTHSVCKKPSVIPVIGHRLQRASHNDTEDSQRPKSITPVSP